MRAISICAAICASLAISACATTDRKLDEVGPQAAQGSAFAEANCSGCHAVKAGGVSPNPSAPPFEAVANRQGLTSQTLRSWLDNSHYYPDVMQFEIAPADVENLAAYIVTLRSDDYRPLPR